MEVLRVAARLIEGHGVGADPARDHPVEPVIDAVPRLLVEPDEHVGHQVPARDAVRLEESNPRKKVSSSFRLSQAVQSRGRRKSVHPYSMLASAAATSGVIARTLTPG